MYLVYVSHKGRFGQPRTNWRRGRPQKAATTRDRCVVHMCASSVLSRRATSPAPAQRKNCHYFSTSSRWDHEKTNLVFRRSPDRGGIVITSSSKTGRNMFFCVSTSMPAEYWYVPRVSYTYRNSITLVVHSDMGRSVVSLSCVVVEYPCLASPGPSGTILSHLGVLACVLGFCLHGFVSIASM